MNLRSVQLFRTIVRLGSLKLAAERLGMSTSSASRMIRVLEHELRLKLFSRHNRKLDLTPEGQEFLQRSQHILEGLERLPDIAAQVRSVDADPLRLVSTLPLAIGIIAPVLAIWQEHHPGVTSVLNIETRFDLESKVAAREYNLGILSLPVENAIVDLDVIPLLSARYEVAIAREHPLAGASRVSFEDLRDEQFIALRVAQRWRRRLDMLAAANEMIPNIVAETSSTSAALELVRRGLGVMPVDRMHTGFEPDDRLRLVPLEPTVWTDYCLVTGKGRTSPSTRDFAHFLKEWLYARCAADPNVASALRLSDGSEARAFARSRPTATI